MFPDSLFHTLQGVDQTEAANTLCQYFLDKDAGNQERIFDTKTYDEYTRALDQFQIFCDPYCIKYTLPSLDNDKNTNLGLIRAFFSSVKSQQ